ncbi:MAG TPA: methylglyoxal synthase [Burkholderiaceae bacterium]|jgi:methylglyoxal synthase
MIAIEHPNRLRIGLASNREHRNSSTAALARLLQEGRSAIERLQPEFMVVGGTMDAIEKHGLLRGYSRIQRFPYGRDGGLMKLVSRAADETTELRLDVMIYLMDPVDPSSSFPEAVALKRQCIIHGKPFLSTFAAAREWLELEAFGLGAAPEPALAATFDLANESIALIAHDAKKHRLLELVERHFDLFDRFGLRYATGTTGRLLNELAVKIKGHDQGHMWVQPCLSGPMGGDAQIAELILDRRCRRVLFLENPHVAREHEADIQLLERASRTMTDFSSYLSEERCAERWIDLLRRRTG